MSTISTIAPKLDTSDIPECEVYDFNMVKMITFAEFMKQQFREDEYCIVRFYVDPGCPVKRSQRSKYMFVTNYGSVFRYSVVHFKSNPNDKTHSLPNVIRKGNVVLPMEIQQIVFDMTTLSDNQSLCEKKLEYHVNPIGRFAIPQEYSLYNWIQSILRMYLRLAQFANKKS